MKPLLCKFVGSSFPVGNLGFRQVVMDDRAESTTVDQAERGYGEVVMSRAGPRHQLGFLADGGERFFSMRVLGPRRVHN